MWDGYGELWRAVLEGSSDALAEQTGVVLKSVAPPAEDRLRVGRQTLGSHRRKLRSYDVELAFYRDFAARCSADCRVPAPQLLERSARGWLFVLEDLDRAGFAGRRSLVDSSEVQACLAWLAAFHARFLGTPPNGLWKVGTYWHLATRPDELSRLDDAALRKAAPAIDAALSASRFKTIVHGDAKLENFCFAQSSAAVAAVDFQYAGGGVGVKDVAYLLGSCFEEAECAARIPSCLDFYFRALREKLLGAPDFDAADLDALETEWRTLYPLAWVDFQRFLLGWAPACRRGDYSERLIGEVLATLSRSHEALRRR